MWLYFIITLVFIGLFVWTRRQNAYFSNKGVKALPVYEPFIGNAISSIFKKEHTVDSHKRSCDKFPNEKYFGVRNFLKPSIMVTDLEIIKLITVKDFDHFMDHFVHLDEKVEPIFGSNLMSLQGQKWRDMRATLSPAFTTSKMRAMFDFVSECGEQTAKYLLQQLEKPENKGKTYLDVELKEIFTRYTNDVIATSAFGIRVNSLEDRENEFYQMGKETTDFSGKRVLKIVTMIFFPRIAKLLGLSMFSDKLAKFFKGLIVNSIEMREKKGIVRQDMIHLLMEAKKGSLKHDTGVKDDKDAGFATVEELDVGEHTIKRVWTTDELVAQAIIFFFAGFETSSSLLSFMGYELAKNPEIQKRLQDEVDEFTKKSNGKIKYDDLKHMKYMDMVVSESLRHWPPSLVSDRQCTKPYTLPPPNNTTTKGCELNVGDGIAIPVYVIHHDPQYYKDPEKFDPERFSDENKHEINPLAYMPFGAGPRSCIGSRFALMEIKAAMFHMLRHFSIIITEKTEIPLQFKSKSIIVLMPKAGFWLGLSPREVK